MDEVKPLVTGISPNEGIPGTKVILRGENLGLLRSDIISVKICGYECVSSLEYMSSSKIAVRTGRSIGRGDIVIETKSAGIGSSLVEYTGKLDKVGPLQEVAYWAEEDIPAVVGVIGRAQTAGTLSQDLLGMQDSIIRRQSFLDLEADNESIDVTKPTFSPSLYLTKTKAGISFDDFCKGLNFLKSTDQNIHNSTNLIKNNIVSLIDAIDIVIDMKGNVVTNRKLNSVRDCCKHLKEIIDHTHSLYDNDLLRNKEADKIRNSVNVFHRFKFLFYLPKNISKFVKQEEYDKAINDYLRAKLLYEDTQVGILKTVFTEANKEIETLKGVLYKKVLSCPQSADSRRSYIRHLEALSEDGQFIARKCVEAEANWAVTQISEQFRLSDEVLNSFESPDIVQEAIDGICEISVSLIRDVVKITNMFVKGKLCLLQKSILKDNFEFIADNITKVHDAFVRRISGILLKPEQKVDAGIFGDNLLQKGNFFSYLSDIIPYGTRVCRFTIYEINSLDIPTNIRSRSIDLLFSLRVECLTVILLKAAYDAATLYVDVDWTIKKDDRIGSYSSLPEKFESIFTSALLSAQLNAFHFDTNRKEKDLLHDKKLNRSSQLLIYGVIAAFFSAFENIINSIAKRPPNGMSLTSICIILFNNLEYLHQTVYPHITNNISSLGYKDSKRLINESSDSFKECCLKVSQTFLKEVIHPLCDRIELTLVNVIPKWDCNVIQIEGVQVYIKHVILNVVNLHAEISSIMFTKINNFSRSGAHRAFIDLSAIRLTFRDWLNDETKATIAQTLDSIEAHGSFQNDRLTIQSIQTFEETMLPMINIFRK
ncbi:hypothetical protein GJ496_010363 [Pomphorhynchus laevis]|nr:hypothetical protein GJ496_010363 [Pomphorhynchus laevis]